jgi:hypothetical protein
MIPRKGGKPLPVTVSKKRLNRENRTKPLRLMVRKRAAIMMKGR